MSKTRVFIYGSCVSRDTFEHLDPEQFELVEYVARQSVLSATTRPVEMLPPPTLESRFQQRMVNGDFTSNLRPLLSQRAGEIDVLLVDLTDERLGVYLLPDGSVVTRTVELIESGAEQSLPQGARHVAFGTQQHFEYWSGAIRALGDTIRNTLPQVAVAILDIPWAEWSENGQQTPVSFGVSAAQANPVFRSYVEVATQALGAHVVALDPSEVMSGPHHPWGDAPFHYAENVYLDIVKRLTGAEGRVIWGAGTSRTMTADLPAQRDTIGATPTTRSRAAVQERIPTAAQSVPSTAGPLQRLDGGPNFLVVGAQRGATQWLNAQLARHPHVHMASGKGTGLFNNAKRLSSDDEIASYLRAFAAPRDERWLGETSPTYFWTSPGSAFAPRRPNAATAVRDRLAPGTQVLVTLRNPVARAVSAYWNVFAQGKIAGGTGLFQAAPGHGIIDIGFYRRHYEQWATAVGEENVHVLVYDDLMSDPTNFIQGAFSALSVPNDPDFWRSFEPKKRVGSRPWLKAIKANSPITGVEIAALLELYRDDIQFIEHVLGRKLPAWQNQKNLIRQNTAPRK